MDYQLPDYCIVSVVKAEEPGMLEIDLQSRWRESPTYIVSEEAVDFVMERVQVGCPPGWPNPPSN